MEVEDHNVDFLDVDRKVKNNMPKFRKIPVTIEAIRIKCEMTVKTLEGTMTGNPGDWMITGVKGEQYFCKDEIFRLTYEPVDDESEKAFLRVKDGH